MKRCKGEFSRTMVFLFGCAESSQFSVKLRRVPRVRAHPRAPCLCVLFCRAPFPFLLARVFSVFIPQFVCSSLGCELAHVTPVWTGQNRFFLRSRTIVCATCLVALVFRCLTRLLRSIVSARCRWCCLLLGLSSSRSFVMEPCVGSLCRVFERVAAGPRAHRIGHFPQWICLT